MTLQLHSWKRLLVLTYHFCIMEANCFTNQLQAAGLLQVQCQYVCVCLKLFAASTLQYILSIHPVKCLQSLPAKLPPSHFKMFEASTLQYTFSIHPLKCLHPLPAKLPRHISKCLKPQPCKIHPASTLQNVCSLQPATSPSHI